MSPDQIAERQPPPRMTMRERCALGVACGILVIGAASMSGAQSASAAPSAPGAAGARVPTWLFPVAPPPTTAVPIDSVTPLSVPRSRARFTEAQLMDRFAVADWHPLGHPQMPEIVARGRPPATYACAFCHLPNGAGRPENAPLAGLPAAYIAQQVADMRSGARHSVSTTPYPPAEAMGLVARNATASEVGVAAAYFAGLRHRPQVRVVEAARVPVTHVADNIYLADSAAGTEPIGARVIEGASDHTRHKRRDDLVTYRAYVPPGSIARGARLATRGIDGAATACVTCHGPALRGVGLVPPLAGRSPSYLVRQLLAFQTSARSAPAGQPMRAVVAKMRIEDMIAAAAYAASRAP